MPAVSTKFRSVSGDQNQRQIGYIVRDASSDIDALDALELAAPPTYDGLTRSAIAIEELKWPSDWEATVTYSRADRTPPETGSVEFSFDIALESQRIVQSNSTVFRYAVPNGSLTDFQKSINVDSSGEPQGVDVRVPTSAFTLSYYPTVAFVSTDYQKAVRDLCGKVNSSTFRGHAAGEVMFVGCSGKARNATDWELTYRFEVRPNRTGITIGNITNIAVDGWDVLWVYRGKGTDGTSNRYIEKVLQVNVERVYERANFATVLGIS
jgi:hypothetical protein